ncbi:MAG: beta-galactosidase [Firmicutes bacterium]|nr:beta-galactosidase [Bacillota bacterium]
MVWQRLCGLGLSLVLLPWILAPRSAEAAATPYVPVPILVDHFNNPAREVFIPNNGLSTGGEWTTQQGSLIATDYGVSSPLANQIASIPHVGENVVIVTSFTINQVNLSQPYRIGVFGRGSTPKTGTSQWDIVLTNGQLSLINQGVGTSASIPFTVAPGQTYDMVAVIDGTWVAAKVWVQGAAEPPSWTITGNFSNTGPFTTVGVVAGNANVIFHGFGAYDAPPTLTVRPLEPSAVYQAGQPVSYVATLAAQAPNQGGAYEIQYQVTDVEGRPLANGTVPVTLPPGGVARLTITLPINANGYYNVTFNLIDSMSVSAPVGSINPASQVLTRDHRIGRHPVHRLSSTVSPSLTALASLAEPLDSITSTLAVVPDAPNLSTLDPNSPFGINGPGNGYGPITPALEQRWVTLYDLFKAQGVEWVRTQFLWNNIEPSPGVYTWDTTDGLVEAAHQAHENILALVDYWGNYANPFPVNGGPQVSFSTFLQDYDQYLQALVARYMPGGTLAQSMGWKTYGINTWEIWNEPSQTAYWPSQNPSQYAQLVASATAAIHAVDPSAVVLAYAWQVPTLLQVAGPTSFTGLSLHEYVGRAYPSVADFYQNIVNLRQLLLQNGIGEDPIWLTETGWSTQVVTPIQQAEYIERAAIESLAGTLNKFFLFKWSYPTLGYGELTANDEPLPSYVALAVVANELSGFTPAPNDNPVNMGAAIRAFLFQNGNTSLIALWSPTKQGSLTLNPASAGLLSAVNWMGNPIVPVDGTLTVPLDAKPVFITGRMPPAVLAALVTTSTVNDIAPVALTIHPLSELPSMQPPITVTITNQTNAPEMGTLTLSLPSGWLAEPTSPTTPVSPSQAPIVTFGPLMPGASETESFNLEQFAAVPTNRYTLTATATVGLPGHLSTVTAKRVLNLTSGPGTGG